MRRGGATTRWGAIGLVRPWAVRLPAAVGPPRRVRGRSGRATAEVVLLQRATSGPLRQVLLQWSRYLAGSLRVGGSPQSGGSPSVARCVGPAAGSRERTTAQSARRSGLPADSVVADTRWCDTGIAGRQTMGVPFAAGVLRHHVARAGADIRFGGTAAALGIPHKGFLQPWLPHLPNGQ